MENAIFLYYPMQHSVTGSLSFFIYFFLVCTTSLTSTWYHTKIFLCDKNSEIVYQMSEVSMYNRKCYIFYNPIQHPVTGSLSFFIYFFLVCTTSQDSTWYHTKIFLCDKNSEIVQQMPEVSMYNGKCYIFVLPDATLRNREPFIFHLLLFGMYHILYLYFVPY